MPLAVHPQRARAQHRARPPFPRSPRRRSSWPRRSRRLARRRPGGRTTSQARSPRPASTANHHKVPARSGPGPTSAPGWRRGSAADALRGTEASSCWRQGSWVSSSAVAVNHSMWQFPGLPARRAARPAAGRGRAGRTRRAGQAPGRQTCLRSTWNILRGLHRGGQRRPRERQRSAGSRCQRQHEGQDTRSIRAATPEWSPWRRAARPGMRPSIHGG